MGWHLPELRCHSPFEECRAWFYILFKPWKTICLRVWKLSGNVHGSTFPPSPFDVLVDSSLVVLVFLWSGNRHTVFIIFSSYFVMIFCVTNYFTIFYLCENAKSHFSQSNTYPWVTCSTHWGSILSGEYWLPNAWYDTDVWINIHLKIINI